MLVNGVQRGGDGEERRDMSDATVLAMVMTEIC
jgi:hypothetical protein